MTVADVVDTTSPPSAFMIIKAAESLILKSEEDAFLIGELYAAFSEVPKLSILKIDEKATLLTEF